MKNPEYYFCYIGPTDRDKLDGKYPNGEGHLRQSIQEAFTRVTGHWPDITGSGWGMKEHNIDQLGFASRTKENQRLSVLSYISENKKMPDYVRAHYLLLREQGVIKGKKFKL